jgi:hypothetical protein
VCIYIYREREREVSSNLGSLYYEKNPHRTRDGRMRIGTGHGLPKFLKTLKNRKKKKKKKKKKGGEKKKIAY